MERYYLGMTFGTTDVLTQEQLIEIRKEIRLALGGMGIPGFLVESIGTARITGIAKKRPQKKPPDCP